MRVVEPSLLSSQPEAKHTIGKCSFATFFSCGAACVQPMLCFASYNEEVNLPEKTLIAIPLPLLPTACWAACLWTCCCRSPSIICQNDINDSNSMLASTPVVCTGAGCHVDRVQHWSNIRMRMPVFNLEGFSLELLCAVSRCSLVFESQQPAPASRCLQRALSRNAQTTP